MAIRTQVVERWEDGVLIESVVVSYESASTFDNQETLHSRARSAIVANRDFLALASPSNLQNAAQVRSLTQQMNALIRLTLGQLDSTD